jgi:hypothetical protein
VLCMPLDALAVEGSVMLTNRLPPAPELRVGQVTPQAVELWRRLRRCHSAESERELIMALDAELKLPPWVESPWTAIGKCPYPSNSTGAVGWPASQALRRVLSAAADGMGGG